MEVNDSLLPELLHNNRPMLMELYRFNFSIAEYVHPSHIENLSELRQLWPYVAAEAPLKKLTSSFLLDLWKLRDKPFWNFNQSRLSLALLPPNELMQLILYAGSVFYTESISKIILRKKVVALQESLGPKLYLFALKRATMLTSLLPGDFPLSPDENKPTEQSFLDAGKRCLEICFSREPAGLTERIKLKLPKIIDWDFNQTVSETMRLQVWQYLKRVATKELKRTLPLCSI